MDVFEQFVKKFGIQDNIYDLGAKGEYTGYNADISFFNVPGTKLEKDFEKIKVGDLIRVGSLRRDAPLGLVMKYKDNKEYAVVYLNYSKNNNTVSLKWASQDGIYKRPDDNGIYKNKLVEASNVIKGLSKESGKTEKEVEKAWDKAIEIYSDDSGLKKDKFKDKDWAIVTTITKNVLDIKENWIKEFLEKDISAKEYFTEKISINEEEINEARFGADIPRAIDLIVNQLQKKLGVSVSVMGNPLKFRKKRGQELYGLKLKIGDKIIRLNWEEKGSGDLYNIDVFLKGNKPTHTINTYKKGIVSILDLIVDTLQGNFKNSDVSPAEDEEEIKEVDYSKYFKLPVFKLAKIFGSHVRYGGVVLDGKGGYSFTTGKLLYTNLEKVPEEYKMFDPNTLEEMDGECPPIERVISGLSLKNTIKITPSFYSDNKIKNYDQVFFLDKGYVILDDTGNLVKGEKTNKYHKYSGGPIGFMGSMLTAIKPVLIKCNDMYLQSNVCNIEKSIEFPVDKYLIIIPINRVPSTRELMGYMNADQIELIEKLGIKLARLSDWNVDDIVATGLKMLSFDSNSYKTVRDIVKKIEGQDFYDFVLTALGDNKIVANVKQIQKAMDNIEGVSSVNSKDVLLVLYFALEDANAHKVAVEIKRIFKLSESKNKKDLFNFKEIQISSNTPVPEPIFKKNKDDEDEDENKEEEIEGDGQPVFISRPKRSKFSAVKRDKIEDKKTE